MAKPKKVDIRTDVVRIISTFTTLDPAIIKDSHILRNPPLLIDTPGLAFLAASLRGYVKQYDREATVTAKEMRSSGLDVSGAVKLIQKKVGAV